MPQLRIYNKHKLSVRVLAVEFQTGKKEELLQNWNSNVIMLVSQNEISKQLGIFINILGVVYFIKKHGVTNLYSHSMLL